MTKKLLPFIVLLVVLPVLTLSARAQNKNSGRHETAAQQEAAKKPDSKLLQAIALSTELGPLRNIVAAAKARKDYPVLIAALERMHALYPYNGDIMLHLVGAYALSDNKRKAFELLLLMQRQGLAADLDQAADLEALKPYGLFPYLKKMMATAEKPYGQTHAVFTLGDKELLATSVIPDQARNRYLVGSASKGVIFAVAPPQKISILADAQHTDGLWSVMDLALDRHRGLLWVASAATPFYRGLDRNNMGHTALLKLDAESGKLIRRYDMPTVGTHHQLSNLAVARDGTVYATDQITPRVYRLSPGADTLQPMYGNDHLTSLRGLALGRDDKVLYVADLAIGLIAIDVASGKPQPVAAAEETNLGGIESMVYHDGALIALQPLMNPSRIMRLTLNDVGTAVQQAAPLAANIEDFATPLRIALNGDNYLLVANSHFNDVLPNGQPKAGKALRDVTVIGGPIQPPAPPIGPDTASRKEEPH